MNFSILPNSLRPRTDLMSKAIVQDPKVINIITTTLVNVQNEYLVGNSEWSNGTRSDVVLEAKSSVLDLPPIVVEIQHTVDSSFMKRVMNYSLETFRRYKLDPIVLIICTDSISDCVVKDVKSSDFPACHDFPSTGWARSCLIMSKAHTQECINTTPLNPFVALGLFFTSQAVTINDTLCPDDLTTQYLYTLALQNHQSQLGDQHIAEILVQVLESQDKEHTKILELIDNDAPSEVVVRAIKTLQSQNHAIKRKYSDMNIGPSSSASTTTIHPTNIENINFTLESVTPYERGMLFVENYKQTRIQKGFKRMDWSACYLKGVELNLFQYKSMNVLRTQFNRYMKQKRDSQ